MGPPVKTSSTYDVTVGTGSQASIKLSDCLLIQQQHQVKLTGSLTSIASNGLGGFLLEEEEKEEEEF